MDPTLAGLPKSENADSAEAFDSVAVMLWENFSYVIVMENLDRNFLKATRKHLMVKVLSMRNRVKS